MWTAKQMQNSKFRCENSAARDTTDRMWDTEEEAAQWATNANEAEEKRIADNKRRAAERSSRQPKPLSETHRMLSTGNDL